jgi:glycosyltransferase involved in cell wall biosynthesis
MKISVFFTRGETLENWVSCGLFDREKVIYESHIDDNSFSKVIWLTYGKKDEELAKKLVKNFKLSAGIKVLGMSKFFPSNSIGYWMYSFFLPLIHRREIKKCEIYKSNQFDGCWAAFLSAKLFNGIFYLRTGFTASKSRFHRNGKRSFSGNVYKVMERWIYPKADICTVTSIKDKEYLECSIKKSLRIFVIGNYIDTRLFYSYVDLRNRKDRFLFIGRLSRQKNLHYTIRVFSELGIGLDIVGDGELSKELAIIAKGFDVNFLGKLPNADIPRLLNKYKYFILPSLYEGNPKTLLEAMSCGLICVGNNAPGIANIINNKNGFLFYNDEKLSVYNVVQHILKEDIDRLDSISKAAVNFIRSKHTLEIIKNKEIDLIKNARFN